MCQDSSSSSFFNESYSVHRSDFKAIDKAFAVIADIFFKGRLNRWNHTMLVQETGNIGTGNDTIWIFCF